MKLQSKIILASVFGALTIGAIAATNSIPAGDFPAFGGGPLQKVQQFFNRLELTDAQKTDLKTVLHNNRPVVKPLVDRLITERRALADVTKAVPVNEIAIRTQSARVAEVEVQLALQRSRIHEQVQAVLTPEQELKVDEAEARMREKADFLIERVRSFIDTI